MKRFLFPLLAASAMTLNAQITETATEAVKNMGVGWNLGNTLDANQGAGTNINAANYWGQQGVESETYWGQPVTKSELFTMMKNAGFGAIRVPVTWFNHMDLDGKVDAAWMARVHEVVDYVIENDLYCILNVHHDTGADSQGHVSWLKADMSHYEQQKARYEYLWQQIAEEFKDYGKQLLFESYNEMLDTYSSWCFATFAAPGNYNATDATSAYNAINSYAQSFVNVVRATGGNNAQRNLIVNTYAACCGTGNWNGHLQDPLKKMKLPEDETAGHLIFEVHSYPAIAKKNGSQTVNRSWNEIKSEVDDMVNQLQTHLSSQGAPVIIGEWGTSNVDSGAGETDYDKRRDWMFQFVDYFVQQTKAAGMGTFFWMGLSDGVCRDMPVFSQPDLAERIVKAYHGNDFVGEYPDLNVVNEYVCFEGDKKLGWGNGITIPSSLFAGFGTEAQFVLTYKQEGTSDDIQFFYGDWSSKLSFVVDGQTLDGDLIPHSFYGTSDGTEHTTCFTFDAETFTKLSQKGLIVHGDCIRLYKAVLQDATASIEDVPSDTFSNTIYNLAGQRVEAPVSGFYIVNGKKMISLW